MADCEFATLGDEPRPLFGRKAVDPGEQVFEEHRRSRETGDEDDLQRLAIGRTDEHRIQREPHLVGLLCQDGQLARQQNELGAEEWRRGLQTEELQIVEPGLRQRGDIVGNDPEVRDVLFVLDGVDLVVRDAQSEFLAQVAERAGYLSGSVWRGPPRFPF